MRYMDRDAIRNESKQSNMRSERRILNNIWVVVLKRHARDRKKGMTHEQNAQPQPSQRPNLLNSINVQSRPTFFSRSDSFPFPLSGRVRAVMLEPLEDRGRGGDRPACEAEDGAYAGEEGRDWAAGEEGKARRYHPPEYVRTTIRYSYSVDDAWPEDGAD